MAPGAGRLVTTPEEPARFTPGGPGRPRGTGKLTDALADKIIEHVEHGNYLKIAALASGVSEGTLHKWLAAGAAAQTRADNGETLDDIDERYRHFRQEITLAQGRAEATVVAAWQAAAFGPDGDWRAGRDLLARMAPERWAGEHEAAMLLRMSAASWISQGCPRVLLLDLSAPIPTEEPE
jgi:hypothetical protein